VGKTTLAAYLARTDEVSRQLPDGVLWATLGQDGELLPNLDGWVQELADDYTLKAQSAEQASARLRRLLHDRAAMLVVDDVWESADALPFLTGGPRCRMLITTRRAAVADELGAKLVPLDPLTPGQALELLGARLGRKLTPAEREKARPVARAVGFLPLALELAAARVGRGTRWRDLLAALKAEEGRLDRLEDPIRRRSGRSRLQATLNLSLRSLLEEDRSAYRAFARLGVLPEDVRIGAPMASILWSVTREEAGELLELLWGESLLLPATGVRLGGREWPTFRVHDLLHDQARRLLAAPRRPGREDQLPGLGTTLREAHVALLNHYRARLHGGLWHTVPDDGYVHARLAWHLEQAGLGDEIHVLLAEENDEGRNGWYEARERLGHTSGYLVDVALAWRRAEKAGADGGLAGDVALQCRYALITASLHTLVSNVPPLLLAQLVRWGVWAPLQGAAYARQLPNIARRAEAVAKLAPEVVDEAERERLVEEAFETTQVERLSYDSTEAITALAPHLTMDQICRALDGLSLFAENDYVRDGAFVALCTRISSLGPAAEAKDVAGQIGDTGRKARALAHIAPFLPDPASRQQVIGEALALARAAEQPEGVEVLADLVPLLAALGDIPAAREVVREIDESGYVKPWAEATAALARVLEPEESARTISEAVRSARTFEKVWLRARVIAILAPFLEPSLRRRALLDALGAVRPLGNNRLKHEALEVLIPRLAEHGLVAEAQEAARETDIRRDRAELRAALAPFLEPSARESILREALEDARPLEDGPFRARVLAALAPHVADPREREKSLRDALETARSVDFMQFRVEAIAALAPHLTDPQQRERVLGEALKAVQAAAESPVKEIIDDFGIGNAITALIPHLADGQLLRAYEASRVTWRDWPFSKGTSELALRLLRAGHREEAMETLNAVRDVGDRLLTLAGMAHEESGLPDGQEDVLSAVRTRASEIEGAGRRAKALAQLIPYLPRGVRGEVRREIQQLAEQPLDSPERAEVLAALAPYLEDPGERERALREALYAARSIADIRRKGSVLVTVAPHLADPRQRQEALRDALDAAIAGSGGRSSEDELAALAPHLATLPPDTLAQLWKTTLRRLAAGPRHQLLLDLIALIPVVKALDPSAFGTIFGDVNRVGRWWP
jgi:hypothetical protein